MHRVVTAAFAAAALTLGAAGAQAADMQVRIATEGAYAPWNFTDSSGNLVGFEVDLAKALCERMNAECEIVPQAWEGIIPALQAKKYDVIMAGMSITDERKKVIDFTRCYAATPAAFVVLKDSPSADFATDLEAINLEEVSSDEEATIAAIKEEFSGKTIGVQVSTTHANFLNEYLADTADIRNYDTQENLDLDLQSGRVDAALAAMSYWVPLLEKPEGKDFRVVGPFMTGGPFGAGVGAGIRKEDPELVAAFDKAIQSTIDDGTLQKLATQWFGFDASCK